jgi:AraC family transcriptional regulator
MGPVQRAIWYIESHFRRDVALQEIAQASRVSRFHLSRAFSVATGFTVMQYLRQRRLSEAASTIAAGAPDILSVALEFGYSSHEAFTRAFQDHFGMPPSDARHDENFRMLNLLEPFQMNDTMLTELSEPRFEHLDGFVVAGLACRYNAQDVTGIPDQWQQFVPYIGQIPGQVGEQTYGVCCNGDGEGNFDYLCAVRVNSPTGLASQLTSLEIQPARYAVFTHSGHISDFSKTVYTIWNQWLPKSDVEHAEAPDFELYDERFNPMTGDGIVEIWLPVRA